MTADPTPTRTSSDRRPELPGKTSAGGSHGTSRPRGVTLAFAALAMGLALFWLGLLFVEYRAGSVVDGAWVFEDPAWGVDLRAYLGAAQRVVDEGSPYAADLTAGSGATA